MKVLIGVPAYGDAVRVNCTIALMALAQRFDEVGVGYETVFLSMARIEAARSSMASRVFRDASFTHILFVDSDVGFRPEAVLRLLKRDTPIAACTYPSRSIDLEAFAKHVQGAQDHSRAVSRSLPYPPLGDLGRVQVQDGWIVTKQAPTGLMLIKRHVFVDLAARYPELLINCTEYPGIPAGPVLQCFSAYRREDGLFLGEDLSFCRRWADMGGEVHVLIDELLSHAGVMVTAGRMLDLADPA